MIEKDIEELLKKGKVESDKFFAESNTDSIRKMVLHKVVSADNKSVRRRFLKRSFLRRAGVSFACMIIFVMLLFYSNIGNNDNIKSSDIPSLINQTISLDENNKDYYVNFFPMSISSKNQKGLISVLWGKDNTGHTQTLYSCIFEDCNQPYPVSTIEMPGNNGKLVLIASSNDDHSFLHYKLLVYTGAHMTTLLSQDYVRWGELKVQDGVIVEKRKTDIGLMNMEHSGREPQVSYIIPYGTSDEGKIDLPIQELSLHKGEFLYFLGCDAKNHFSVSSENGNIEQLETNNIPYAQIVGEAFVASHIGDGRIILTSSNKNSCDLIIHVEE